MNTLSIGLLRCQRGLSGIALSGTSALAQANFGQASPSIATEMIAVAKLSGIILCIISGSGLMAGGGHRAGTFSKVIAEE